MPFTIGKVFSDESQALMERKREFDAEQAQKAYALELQRRRKMDDSSTADAELGLKGRSLDLEQRNQDERMRLAQQQFGADTEQKNRQLDLGEREYLTGVDAKNAQFQLATNDDKRQAEALRYQMEVKDPTTFALTKYDTDRKAEADKNRNEIGRAGLDIRREELKGRLKQWDAQADFLSSKRNLTDEQARQYLQNQRVRSFEDAIKLGTLLQRRAEAASDVNNANFNKEAADAADEDMASFLAALKKGSPMSYGEVIRMLNGNEGGNSYGVPDSVLRGTPNAGSTKGMDVYSKNLADQIGRMFMPQKPAPTGTVPR